nr:receptor-like protein EIX1 [Ziziphus jujuba var. spinosa]
MESFSIVAFVFLTVAFVSALILCSGNAEVLRKESERQALLRFKKDLKDPMNRLSSWDSEADYCSWTGVACHKITGHVLELHLGSPYDVTDGYVLNSTYSFGGKINPSLLDLKYLNYLDLSWNDFEGIQIPSFIGSLKSLTYLDLSYAVFGGIIPHQLGNLSNLRYLYLCESSLVGNMPSAIGNLTSIRILELSSNELEGEIPKSLGNLCRLKELHLGHNKLNGSISEVFELWSKCTKNNSIESLTLFANKFSVYRKTVQLTIYVSSNQLNGSLPKSFGQLVKLEELDTSNNQLTGSIPESFGQLVKLEALGMSNNQLTGSLPESFGQLVKLEFFDMSNNSLKGVVSEIHFSSLTRLKYLKAFGNSLTLKTSLNWVPPFQLEVLNLNSWYLGPQLPVWIRWQQHLLELQISNTGISDTIPAWFCNISSHLQYLNLSRNQFHGEYPCTVHSMAAIDLSSNLFNGSLPILSSNIPILDFSTNSFSGSVFHFCDKNNNFTPMEYSFVNLENNFLSGVIPKCWKKWKMLYVLNLRGNNLEGVIPSSMGYLTNLLSLQLSRNNLSGELPLSLRECTAMCTLDISENNFFGAIPNWIGMSLLKLKILNLHSNKFGGDIPLEVCNLKGLHVLDLAHNNISGTIPKCFYNLSAMTTLANPDDDTSEYYFPTLGDSDDFLVGDNVKLVTKGREISYSSILNLVRIIDLSDNNIQGEITVELTRLLQLQTLNLSNNHLTGKIPSKMGDMKDLESLDLSRNQLYGEIPASISSLTVLSHLDLSYNNFTGRIPTSTQLQSFNESSFIGNQLCGAPLLQNCSVIETTLKGGKREWQGYLLEENSLFLSLGLGFAFGFWGLLGSLFFNTPWSIAFCGFLNRIVLKLYAVIFEKF